MNASGRDPARWRGWCGAAAKPERSIRKGGLCGSSPAMCDCRGRPRRWLCPQPAHVLAADEMEGARLCSAGAGRSAHLLLDLWRLAAGSASGARRLRTVDAGTRAGLGVTGSGAQAARTAGQLKLLITSLWLLKLPGLDAAVNGGGGVATASQGAPPQRPQAWPSLGAPTAHPCADASLVHPASHERASERVFVLGDRGAGRSQVRCSTGATSVGRRRAGGKALSTSWPSGCHRISPSAAQGVGFRGGQACDGRSAGTRRGQGRL